MTTIKTLADLKKLKEDLQDKLKPRERGLSSDNAGSGQGCHGYLWDRLGR
jgi:hypothetical protein